MQLTSQHQQALWSLEALVLSEKDLQEKECLGKGGKQREERWRREGEPQMHPSRSGEAYREVGKTSERQLSGRQAPAHRTHRRLLITALGAATCGPCCWVAL